MNTTSYASNIVHRLYPAHWMRFCKSTELDARTYAVFKDSNMRGLSIPVSEYTPEFRAELEDRFKFMQIVSRETDPVEHLVVKNGSYFYDVYLFEKNISIEVNSATNPKLI